MITSLVLGLMLYSQSRPGDECYKFASMFGGDIFCEIKNAPFEPAKERLKRVGEVLLLDGKPVWLYSVDASRPDTRVEKIALNVNETPIVIPNELLLGLYDIGVLRIVTYIQAGEKVGDRWEFTGSAWLEPDRKSWHVNLFCGDGGVGFEVCFSGKLGEPVVERTDYRETHIVGRFSAKVSSK